MKFMARGLFGLCLLTLTVALLALAGNTLVQSAREKAEGGKRPRVAKERVFLVEVQRLVLVDHAPVITTFGEVVSGTTLELRAAAGGALVRLSPNFREGGQVKRGDLLFQTDPSNARSKMLLAEAELVEAETDLADATGELSLSEQEVLAAIVQRELREQALARQRSLKERGLGTDAAMETVAMSASSAEQAVLARRLGRNQAVSRIARAKNAIARRKISLDEATRIYNDTSVYAEFDGVLSGVGAVMGGLVTANEKLGSLIDPRALEVAFRLSNVEFGALTRAGNDLRAASVTVRFGGLAEVLTGEIERVSAAVGAGQTGRELFAKLGGQAVDVLRPGDFVTVQVREPVLHGVTVIPARSASAGGSVLLVGDEDKLEEGQVIILRKQGEMLVVQADNLAGRDLVVARAPQLGAGIRVETRVAGGSAGTPKEPEKIEVSDTLRQQMIAYVEANKRMPKRAKKALLQRLNRPKLSKSMVDRLTKRMGS